jgi:hypothetical protein
MKQNEANRNKTKLVKHRKLNKTKVGIENKTKQKLELKTKRNLTTRKKQNEENRNETKRTQYQRK